MKTIYCKARFGEGLLGRGMGYGNRIFPWARCLIFAKQHNLPVISPVWMRPALGQLVRGGVDLSSYLRQIILFRLFRKRTGDLSVLQGVVMTTGFNSLPDTDIDVDVDALESSGKRTVILFEGYEHYFQPLNGWNEYIYAELKNIAREKYLNWVDQYPIVPIVMNIRCGNDFDTPDETKKRLKPGEKTPIKWFVQCLTLLRQHYGSDVNAYIVSDGTRQQLKELLSLPNVAFVRPASAISDLLVISKAKVLFASGSSSFSAWGSFLGQMPCISHPGQDMSEWKIEPQKEQYIGEFDPGLPNVDVIREMCTALGNSA